MANFHARAFRENTLKILCHLSARSALAIERNRHIHHAPNGCLRARRLKPSQDQIGGRKRLLLRRPADLRYPNRLLRIAVFRHQFAQLANIPVQLPFRRTRIGIRMDVHYVEPFRSTETIYLIDEPQRHAGSASNCDTNRRIDLLYRLECPFQKLGIRLGARRFPEHRVIGFVPDLDDWNTPSIAADDPANVLFPLIQMLVGRRCPRRRISENRQRLNPRRLARCHNPVQF